MQYNHYIHDLDIPENPGSNHNFVDPSNHHASVHTTQMYSLQEGAYVQSQLSFQLDQLSPEPLVSLLSQFLLLLACCLASQYLWANYLQHLCFFLLLAHLLLLIVGDATGPTCSEFIPSALLWPLGPCPWLLPGIIASNYTTRGAQPLRYHAKIQQDLITTTSIVRLRRIGSAWLRVERLTS